MEVIFPAHGHISAALLHSRQADKKELVFLLVVLDRVGNDFHRLGRRAGREGNRDERRREVGRNRRRGSCPSQSAGYRLNTTVARVLARAFSDPHLKQGNKDAERRRVQTMMRYF